MENIRTALELPEDQLNDAEKDIVANIRKYGWHSTHVFDPEGKDPSFTYSTGFWKNRGAPEIVTFSLSQKTAHGAIGYLFDLAKRGALPVRQRISALRNADVFLVPVGKERYREYLLSARWFYRREEFPCLQMIWPDLQNRFSWEERADQDFLKDQLILAEDVLPN